MNIKQLYHIFKSCKGVSTDSRRIPEGCLFVALKGERFDGNKYALNALEKGAAYALVSDKQLSQNDQLIQVEDTLDTLQKLARHHRRQFDIPFVAITGSNGKTTTKELVSVVLSARYKTHFTKGNFNNHIGVPLTLLALPSDTEIAIIEMGANHIGEIDFLCQIAEPTHGLITNVGKAHLEGFGSFEGVKQTKSELYRYLSKTWGKIFINRDEAHLQDLLPREVEVVPYQKGNNGQFEIDMVSADPFVKITLKNGESHTISTHLIGAYNFNNILTAITVGHYFDVVHEAMKTAIEAYTPTNNRSQFLEKNTNKYILDAYNANPTSMHIAVDNFSKLQTDLDKIVVLGDMLELGEDSEAEHQKIVATLETSQLKYALLVGQEFGKVNLPDNGIHFKDVQTLKDWFDEQKITKIYFLIKGSRGIRLEKLLEENK